LTTTLVHPVDDAKINARHVNTLNPIYISVSGLIDNSYLFKPEHICHGEYQEWQRTVQNLFQPLILWAQI
jgi:hypothetical protein